MPSRQSMPTVESLRPGISPLPQFVSPSDEPTPSPSPSDPPSPSTTSDVEWDSPPHQSAELDEAPAYAGPTSSRASSGEVLGELKIDQLAYGLVEGAGELLHDNLARDAAAQDAGLWLTDEQDQAAIGDPLANMLGRHVPKDVLGDTDASDVVAAMVGVALYSGKQFMKWLGVRRARKEGRRAAAAAAAAFDAQQAPDASPAGSYGAF